MFGRSLLLNYVGEVDRAVEELERSVEQNPILLSFASWTPNALLYAGETGRFLELVPAAVSPLLHYYQAEALVRAGRTSEAVATLEAVFASNPGDLFARLCESYRLHLAGDAAGALAVLQALERRPPALRRLGRRGDVQGGVARGPDGSRRSRPRSPGARRRPGVRLRPLLPRRSGLRRARRRPAASP